MLRLSYSDRFKLFLDWGLRFIWLSLQKFRGDRSCILRFRCYSLLLGRCAELFLDFLSLTLLIILEVVKILKELILIYFFFCTLMSFRF